MSRNEVLACELENILEGTVPIITPGNLHKKMSDEPVVLLDIRSPAEQEVSTLPGSRNFDFEEFDPGQVDQLSKNDTIVVYCSVGYRSEKAGELLQREGFQHVLNLYGGIFEWKNKGYEILNSSGEPTDSVHTYDESWSGYLKRGIKVYD